MALFRGSAAAFAAMLWCGLFACLHLFWGFGGSFGLASSAGSSLASRRPIGFVIFGLYGVALLLLIGIGLIAMMVRAPASSSRRRASAALIAGVGVVLFIRGAVLEVLLAVNAGGIRTTLGPLEVRWSLTLWNPWFALGGALFVVLPLRCRSAAAT